MNTLPTHRRALAGRTHSRTFHAGDFDPIERPPARNGWAGVLLVCAIGVALALALFFGQSV